MSWDRFVLPVLKAIRSKLGVAEKTHAYIQAVVLQQTADIVTRKALGMYDSRETTEEDHTRVFEEISSDLTGKDGNLEGICLAV